MIRLATGAQSRVPQDRVLRTIPMTRLATEPVGSNFRRTDAKPSPKPKGSTEQVDPKGPAAGDPAAHGDATGRLL
jgi:hypothetical protein